MTTRAIIKYPATVLKEPAREVTSFDGTLHTLLDDMRQTMYTANGIGLAAPQVNESLRVAVADISEDRNQNIELVNPKIIAREGEVPSEEGCLSIPEYRESISRSEKVQVSAFDRNGKPFTLEADGLLAICLQHEIDHLDGVLFIDRMSRLKKELFKKWFKKHGAFE